jgi:hypothetical protein
LSFGGDSDAAVGAAAGAERRGSFSGGDDDFARGFAAGADSRGSGFAAAAFSARARSRLDAASCSFCAFAASAAFAFSAFSALAAAASRAFDDSRGAFAASVFFFAFARFAASSSSFAVAAAATAAALSAFATLIAAASRSFASASAFARAAFSSRLAADDDERSPRRLDAVADVFVANPAAAARMISNAFACSRVHDVELPGSHHAVPTSASNGATTSSYVSIRPARSTRYQRRIPA